MPGKYSHSVVLADFSSRGMISLPDEQHVKYINASPQQQNHSASKFRGHSTQPAQAAYRPASIPRQGWDARTSDRPHPSLTTHTTPSRTRVNVPVDTNDTEARLKRLSQVYEQLPQRTPPILVCGQAESMREPVQSIIFNVVFSWPWWLWLLSRGTIL